jgi:hypothetical protein
MKPLKPIALMFILIPALASAPAKTKKPYKLPAVFDQARYVYVEAVDGQDFDPRLNPDDRQAIADVYKAVYDWKRYVLTEQRREADLIFVVRKGRLAEARLGAQIGTGRQGTTPNRPAGAPAGGNGVGIGGAVGPPDDLLEIYAPNPNESRGTLLWRRTLADGLNAPDLTLFKQLKDEVESTYPIQTANKASKP